MPYFVAMYLFVLHCNKNNFTCYRSDDSFASLVTLDITSEGYNNPEAIRQFLQEHIQKYQSIGSFTLSSSNIFKFTDYGGKFQSEDNFKIIWINILFFHFIFKKEVIMFLLIKTDYDCAESKSRVLDDLKNKNVF